MADSIFGAWSTAELKEYIQENGYPCLVDDRSELIRECEKISRDIEVKVLRGASGCTPTQPPAPHQNSYPPVGDSKYPSVLGSGDSKYPSTALDSKYPGSDSSRYPGYGPSPAPYGGSQGGCPPAPSHPGYPPTNAAPPPPSYIDYNPWLPSSHPSPGNPAPPYPPMGAAYLAPPLSPAGSGGYPPAGTAHHTTPAYPGYPSAHPSAAAPYPSTPGMDGRAGSHSGGSGSRPPMAAAPSGPLTAGGGGGGYPGGGHPAGVPPAMPPPGGSKKKALICGCNYFGTSAMLNGCINDAKCMEYLLKTKFGYRPENILLMVDNHKDPLRRPTRYNMMQGITWLLTGMKPGDSLFFHFSGHGGQKRDYSGEEADGMNETLCPCDFKQAGEIVDDEINRYLVNPLPTGVKLHAVVDACHSGSAFDLPFHATIYGGRPRWQSEYQYRTRAHKGTAGGFCVQFGASKDSQVAADTSALSGTGVSTGAATYAFIQAIEHMRGSITYGQLLASMHQTLEATTGGSGGGSMLGMTALLGGLLGGGGMGGFRGQEPVLSATYAFDLNYKFDL